MAILEAVEVPNQQAFRQGLAERDTLTEKARFVAAHLGWDGDPGFAETFSRNSGACSVSLPLFDECTVVLLYGVMQLDDEVPLLTGTNIMLRIRGHRTLKILRNSQAMWSPAPCCWDVERCHFSLHGNCKRLGIGNFREAKKPKETNWDRLRRFTKVFT